MLVSFALCKNNKILGVELVPGEIENLGIKNLVEKVEEK